VFLSEQQNDIGSKIGTGKARMLAMDTGGQGARANILNRRNTGARAVCQSLRDAQMRGQNWVTEVKMITH
jgi:hypothetical protein